jgi:hypothetical protein
LRHCIGTIEEESHDFFEGYVADVHGAVDAMARLRPIHLAHRNLPRLSFSTIAKFDVEQISAQHHRDSVKGIAVPRRCLPRRQPLSADEIISAMVQHLLISRQFHVSFLLAPLAESEDTLVSAAQSGNTEEQFKRQSAKRKRQK